MVKNWADHCSSDEEEEYDNQKELTTEVVVAADEQQGGESTEEPQNQAPKQDKVKTYEFPSAPPYTAYVGNLAYTISDPDEVAEQLTALAMEKLGVEIKIESARLVMDRQSEKPRHRGFGYVKVETVDMLKALMQLNDGENLIAGRKVQLDTATEGNRRGGRSSDVDGSKFRSGKFNKRDSGRRSNKESSDAPSGQRPSLNLKPRSKPLEDDAKNSTPPSSIFGGAKPRDELNWRDRSKTENEDRRKPEGRGDRRGPRNSNNGGRGQSNRTGKDNRKTEKTEPKPAPTPAPAPAPQPKVETKSEPKVTNKFAALDFDSDSE